MFMLQDPFRFGTSQCEFMQLSVSITSKCVIVQMENRSGYRLR